MDKKILIIEDDHKAYDKMADIISDDLFQYDNVYPSFFKKRITDNFLDVSFDNFVDDFSIFLKLFSKLSKENCNSIFEFITERFTDVNYYIIDKELISESGDDFGLKFYNYLINTKKVDSNSIFVVTSHPKSELNMAISNDFIIQKDKHYDYLNELVAKIKKQKK